MKSKDISEAGLLLLTDNEIEILNLIQKNKLATPVILSKQSLIPRPTIYITLDKLKERGLIQLRKDGKKMIWMMTDTDAILEKIDKIKNIFISDKTDYQKISLSNDTDLITYRGEKTLSRLFLKFIEERGGNRLMGIQGDFSGDAWKDTFALKNMNEINAEIKNKGLITEIITSKDWFEKQIENFGKSWADNYAGRAAQVHFIDSKYLDYESQIFIFKNQLYLVSMREKLFIEVKNQQISKLIMSLFRFVEDHSPSVDVNKLLREMENKTYSSSHK